MINNLFDFTIITPEEVFVKTKTSSLIVPGQHGFFGVQKDHVDLIGTIKSGIVSFKEQSKGWTHIFVAAGCISISKQQSLILVEKACALKDFDITQIKNEIKQQQHLMQSPLSSQQNNEFHNQINYLENILKSLELIDVKNKNLNN